jgi:hypothetical protein
MALKKALNISGTGYVSFGNFYIETGETLFNTGLLYIKVESVNGTKDFVSATVSYTDEAKNKKLLEKSFSFTPNMDSNFIAQAYNHLKTLPEFAGAGDC